MPLALVIDDEPDICELLSLTLGRMDIDTDVAEDVAGQCDQTGLNSVLGAVLSDHPGGPALRHHLDRAE